MIPNFVSFPHSPMIVFGSMRKREDEFEMRVGEDALGAKMERKRVAFFL